MSSAPTTPLTSSLQAASSSPAEFRDIPGLVNCGTAQGSLLTEAQKEIMRGFDATRDSDLSRPYGRRRMSDVMELGVPFTTLEKDSTFRFNETTASGEFRATLELIAQETARNREHVNNMVAPDQRALPNNDWHINVVIRRYRPGQSIGFHIDRLEKFEHPVWNLVLLSTNPEGGLHYENPVDNTKVPVHESRGLVTVQTGKARAELRHGVPTVKSERISITWRWFKPEYLRTLPNYDFRFIQEKMRSFVSRVRALEQVHASATVEDSSVTPPPYLKSSAPGAIATSTATSTSGMSHITSEGAGTWKTPRSVLSHPTLTDADPTSDHASPKKTVMLLCGEDRSESRQVQKLCACVRRGIEDIMPDVLVRTLGEAQGKASPTQSPDVYVSISGGFAVSDRMIQAQKEQRPVLSVGCVGGASAGWFGAVPRKPAMLTDDLWNKLQDCPRTGGDDDSTWLARVSGRVVEAVKVTLAGVGKEEKYLSQEHKPEPCRAPIESVGAFNPLATSWSMVSRRTPAHAQGTRPSYGCSFKASAAPA